MKYRNLVLGGTLLLILSLLGTIYYPNVVFTGLFYVGAVITLLATILGRFTSIAKYYVVIVVLLGAILKLQTVVDIDYAIWMLLALYVIVFLYMATLRKRKVVKKVKKPKKQEMVVVTKNGKIFHKKDCITLRRSRQNNLVTLTKKEAIRLGYKPCRICKS